MLPSAGKKNIFFHEHHLSGCFLEENTCVRCLFLIQNIAKFLKWISQYIKLNQGSGNDVTLDNFFLHVLNHAL